MRLTVSPRKLCGEIDAIASKSQAHRLLICAGLASTPTQIICRELSKDIEATAGCIRAMGGKAEYSSGVYSVEPVRPGEGTALLDCGESGSTLRFLLPVVCAMGIKCRIRLHGRLPERPLSPLWEELERHGARLSRPERDIIAVNGRISGGRYTIAANISSQFISGLLLALPLTAEGGEIELTGNIESESYIGMTRRAQENFGVESRFENNVFYVPHQIYISPKTMRVEGDWSNAAFWIAAERLSGERLKVSGLDFDSPQGDRAVIKACDRIMAGDAVIDARDIPDLVPILSVLASVSPGTTEFINAGRLRIKESDRIKSVKALLENLGADVTETEQGLIIKGKDRLTGGCVDSAGDHRIAMCAAVASIACSGPVTVDGAEAVSKSYPAFWQDFESLGGSYTLEE